MFNNGFGNTGDFEALARQYWSAWGDAMRQAGLGGAPAQPANQWQQAVDWWSRLMPNTPGQANDAVARFNQQASHWFGQMQQVAAQFAGQDHSSADIGQAWRKAMGANGDNPFPDMFKAMRGQGAKGLEDWLDQVKPYLDGFLLGGDRLQNMSAFGQYREHQERWQALYAAHVEYQERTDAFNALMMVCAQRAFDVFESKLASHEEPGRQLTSARALFDLWIDSAEEAYAGIALSAEFREVYGALANAQMRLRAGIQREVEQVTGLFGMPSRTEVDSAHRKIADLERALRRATKATTSRQEKRAATPAAPVEVPPAKPARKAKRTARKAKPPAKPAKRAPAAKRAPVRKAASRKRAAGPAVKQSAAIAGKPAAPVARGKPPAAAKAPKRAARKAATKAPAKPAKAATKVVSMKDWVARYAAANMPAAIGSGNGSKQKARK